MTPPDSPGYLPAEQAARVRSALTEVADQSIRSQVLGACEAAFAAGHTAGYERGFEDGTADVEARLRPARARSWTQPPPPEESQPRIVKPSGESAYQALGAWSPDQEHETR